MVNYKPLSEVGISIFQLTSLLSVKEYKVPRFLKLRRIFPFLDRLKPVYSYGQSSKDCVSNVGGDTDFFPSHVV